MVSVREFLLHHHHHHHHAYTTPIIRIVLQIPGGVGWINGLQVASDGSTWVLVLPGRFVGVGSVCCVDRITPKSLGPFLRIPLDTVRSWVEQEPGAPAVLDRVVTHLRSDRETVALAVPAVPGGPAESTVLLPQPRRNAVLTLDRINGNKGVPGGARAWDYTVRDVGAVVQMFVPDLIGEGCLVYARACMCGRGALLS
jgi:hypothetical protein